MDLPERIGVYGGGRMGAGIAHACLIGGADVVVIEVDDDQVEAAAGRIDRSLGKAAERGITTDAGYQVSTDAGRLADVGLVIEAVPEIVELKHQVLRTIEQVPGLGGEVPIGTNTSSLSVSELATALREPGRLIGLHFFNPVPASDLVEIVVGEQTPEELVARANGWVRGLGKTPITVKDSPGFASSRLGVAIAMEAIRMVEEGVGTAEDIDTAMTLGYRHPVGPLKTTDIVGLDVRLAIAEHLAAELGDRFTPPDLLRRKVEAGELGRKSGQGFYAW